MFLLAMFSNFALYFILGKREKKKGQAKYKEGYEEAAGISTPSKEVVEDAVTSEINHLVSVVQQPPLSTYVRLAGDKNLHLVSCY